MITDRRGPGNPRWRHAASTWSVRILVRLDDGPLGTGRCEMLGWIPDFGASRCPMTPARGRAAQRSGACCGCSRGISTVHSERIARGVLSPVIMVALFGRFRAAEPARYFRNAPDVAKRPWLPSPALMAGGWVLSRQYWSWLPTDRLGYPRPAAPFLKYRVDDQQDRIGGIGSWRTAVYRRHLARPGGERRIALPGRVASP